MKAFAEDYDVVAISMRGYGDSDKPKVCPFKSMSCMWAIKETTDFYIVRHIVQQRYPWMIIGQLHVKT